MSIGNYTLVDLIVYPHLSRLYFMKDSVLDSVYWKFKMETKFPLLTKFYNQIRDAPEFGAMNQSKILEVTHSDFEQEPSFVTAPIEPLGAIVPCSYFQLWL